MRIRTNKLMDSYLKKLEYDFMKKEVKLPTELETIVNSPFETTNHLFTLQALNKLKENPIFETDSQKCYWEYDTHFHPDMFVPNGNPEIEYLTYALECAKQLSLRLKNSFSTQKFIVSVAFSETSEKDGEVEFHGSSTVRFYHMRPGCNMKSGDLNQFTTEAVLEIET